MPKVFVNPKAYQWLQDSDRRINDLYGGASSGKSWTMGQFTIVELFNKQPGVGILVLRKTKPAVRTSCWELLTGMIKRCNIPSRQNKSTLTIESYHGSRIMCDGLDDVFKKKSIEGVNYIWIEEVAGIAHDARITEREFKQLDIIARAPNPYDINKIFCTFNPVDPVGNEWLYDRTVSKSNVPDYRVLRVTHTDNPFLAAAERARIEALADGDKEYNKIYRLGEWATPTHIIYTNWDIVERMPMRYEERFWGLDFGYSGSEAALVEVRFCGDEVYEKQHIYRTGLTNPQLVELLNEIVLANEIVVGDSAEPKSLQELRNAGLNVHGSRKGPDSVRFGIKTVKRYRTHLLATSLDLIKEKRGYKWKTDADENPLSEPLKFRDHLMDAERYAITKAAGPKAGVVFSKDDDKIVDELENENLWSEY